MKRRDFATGLSAGLIAAALGARAAVPAAFGPFAAVQGAKRAWDLALAGQPPTLGRSDALLILRGGATAFEAYGAGHGPAVRHIAWSMTKSLTQALVGVAVGQGRVDIDAPLAILPHPAKGLSLRALLTLTDGLQWDEGGYDPAKSDAARMLFGPGRFDGAAYVAAKPQAFAPGSRWNYSTGAFSLASAELQRRLFPDLTAPDARRAAMLDWMRGSFFDPLGMTSAQPEFDAAGHFAGGSFFYATARDFARFGELYRLDGVWKGERLLPVGWVRFARTPTVEATYGAGFWLEAPAGHAPPSLMGGAGPMDAFSAEGHEGQVILIVPSKELVVVRLGLMDDGDAAWKALGAWLAPIVAAPSRIAHEPEAGVGAMNRLPRSPAGGVGLYGCWPCLAAHPHRRRYAEVR